jgi:homoserine O-succinyltransferase
VTVRLTRAASLESSSLFAVGEASRWTCALVNNMPDTAFVATERQFLELLESASGPDVIEVRRHTLKGVPRDEHAARRISEEYASLSTLRNDPPDLLIVTGSNPIERDIEDEPYWDEMVDLLTWASECVPSMLLSCLSAHAALTIFDGIERQRLPLKRTGVFLQQVKASQPLTTGIDAEILLPHSRNNTVAEEALEGAGYDVLVESEDVGWSVATRRTNNCDVVLVQGHPEYEPSSLLREYHRDAGRYVRFERDDLPVLPYHCVADEDWEQLVELHRAIIGGQREPELLEAYPFEEAGSRAARPWQPMAQRLYANWLASVEKERN